MSEPKPFVEHVQELRRRLAWSVFVLLVFSGVGYLVRDPILNWLQAPLHGNLYYSNVTGAFEFVMQACLLVGVLAAIPVVVYNLIAFIQPALKYPATRGQIAGVVVASCALAIGGVGFAYYVSLPAVLHFMSTIDVSHLHPLIAANSYLSFVIAYLGTFAAIFQLPLVILFIDRFTPLPPAGLRRWRKWVIIGAFGAALVLPIAPDPVSQVMLALPIVIQYELSIWLVVLAHRRRRRLEPKPQPRSSATVAASSSIPRPPRHVRPPRPVMESVVRAGHPRVIDLREH